MQFSCVGFLELSTIAQGIQVTDALLKKASVKLVFSYPVSSGKYLTFFEGEVEDVRSSLAAARELGGSAILDFFLLPMIHPDIMPAVQGKIVPDKLDAIGILETTTCASCIVACDIALKTSKVKLIHIQLAKGIGGKAYFVLEGEVGEMESAMAASMRKIPKERIVSHVIIPHATPELLSLFQ